MRCSLLFMSEVRKKIYYPAWLPLINPLPRSYRCDNRPMQQYQKPRAPLPLFFRSSGFSTDYIRHLVPLFVDRSYIDQARGRHGRVFTREYPCIKKSCTTLRSDVLFCLFATHAICQGHPHCMSATQEKSIYIFPFSFWRWQPCCVYVRPFVVSVAGISFN
jgi:hypothetical protein